MPPQIRFETASNMARALLRDPHSRDVVRHMVRGAVSDLRRG